ncbi:MAG: class I SAM-dependent methyltransferase, partial [Proteobacteria bacterium]|nr:class I SAM-dependent methyltransferase [Pseudomonadota bacterium]
VERMLTPAVLEEVGRLRTAGQAHFIDKDIPGFIATMRNWVNGVQIVHSSLGWNTEAYQEQELGAPEPQSPKEKAMDGLYDRYQPETLLDLGCNKGRFSYLAALRNVRTYAFDTAESLIDKLYLFAKATGLPIQAHVVDGARLEPFSDPEIRFDMVAYLAVIHHLIFTFGKTVQEVVAQADGLCERVAILEYVSSDPAETFVYTNYDPELYPDYNVPGITRELLKYFDAVEAIDISVSRTLLVASREGRPDTRKVHER